MRKRDRERVLKTGRVLLQEVCLNPHAYYVVLGSYLNNKTLFGKIVRWFDRDDASHSSVVFMRKGTSTPALEIHSIEGWGVIATDAGVLGKVGATLELRRVEGTEDTDAILEKLSDALGSKYEKPFGFVTKSRANDLGKWFCSELANYALSLQNCPDHLVSPAWARRSAVATEVIARIKL